MNFVHYNGEVVRSIENSGMNPNGLGIHLRKIRFGMDVLTAMFLKETVCRPTRVFSTNIQSRE